jgi:hypothetical protein
MFGNNLDVLGEEETSHGGGYMGAGGSGRTSTREQVVAVELILDSAILEDGRCVGPNELAMFETVSEDLEHIRRTAEQGAEALRNGASAGEIFELLRPLARRTHGRTPEGRPISRSPFLGMFANSGIQQLINGEPATVAAWFETQAQPPRLRLYRPS